MGVVCGLGRSQGQPNLLTHIAVVGGAGPRVANMPLPNHSQCPATTDLSMDVAADGDGAGYGLDVALVLQDLLGLGVGMEIGFGG